MLEKLISECSDYDFKESLEEKKPKSWLKSVSAFANGIGGKLFFGISNDKQFKNIENPQLVIEKITDFIDKRIVPKIEFKLTPYEESGNIFIELKVEPGYSTPYYYHQEGTYVAYIRSGSSSIEAPDYILNELILKGKGKTYDAVVTGYKKEDFAFSILERDFFENDKRWIFNKCRSAIC